MLNYKTLTVKWLTILMCILFVQLSFATSLTPTQIAQFNSLPQAQKEALARQLGVDLDAVQAANAQTSTQGNEEINAPVRVSNLENKEVSSNLETSNEETRLPSFGYDFFDGQAQSFSAVDNMPIPLDYVIAPGDVIRVTLYGKTDREYQLKVDRDGKITFPEFGPEYVAGQTFEELKQYIKSLISKKIIGVETMVSLGSMRTMQVFVTGEVKKPGAYNVNGITTLSQLILSSGGVKESGSLRHIVLKRNGKSVGNFDAYNLLLNGDASQDIRLMSGDTLFIPVKKQTIAIEGAVARPAYYELKGASTLEDALNYAGGSTAKAYLPKVSIIRYSTSGKSQFTVDLTKRDGRNYVLKNGDEVIVPQVSERLNHAIALRGEVARQGTYTYHAGMKVSDVITSLRSDLKETADLNYALVVRENSLSGKINVLQFNLSQAILSPSSQNNLSLQENDQIFVFDNGVDSDYWYRSKKNERVKVDAHQIQSKVESVDGETGAVIIKDAKEKNEADLNGASHSDTVKRTSREELLRPIIDRIKAQSSLHEPASLIEVTGAVKYPGVYPLPKNADFSKVIAAVGGFSEQAYMYKAELSRYQKTSNSFEVTHRNFSPQEVLSGSETLDLSPQDSIIIKTQPNWQKDNTIELQGEVVFPGTYTFQRGERISDVIRRAGGLTSFAYPHGAVFSRDSLKRQEQERLKLLNVHLKQEIGSLALRRQTSNASYTSSPTEAMAVADQLSSTEAIGRLVIDLPLALEGKTSSDIMLEKGDKLYIPAKQPIISVMGEVQFASNHTFDSNKTVDDYISEAGGSKKQADIDRIYVVRADGSVYLPNNSFWFSRQSKPLEPGDTIIVPIDTDYLDGLSSLTSATQILYQIGVAWSAIK